MKIISLFFCLCISPVMYAMERDQVAAETNQATMNGHLVMFATPLPRVNSPSHQLEVQAMLLLSLQKAIAESDLTSLRMLLHNSDREDRKKAIFTAIALRKVAVIEELLLIDQTLANTRDSNGDSPLMVVLKTTNRGCITPRTPRPITDAAVLTDDYKDDDELDEDDDHIANHYNGVVGLDLPNGYAKTNGKKALDDDELNHTIVRILLDAEADPDYKNKRNETALMLAAQKQDKHTLMLLLNRSKQQGAFLHWFIENSEFTFFEEIFDLYRFPLHHKNDKGETGMHICALLSIANKMRKLIRSGAHINEQDKYGQTPLMIAASKKNRTLVAMLLESSAIQINLCDARKFDALDHTFFGGYHDEMVPVAQCLIKAGANLGARNRGVSYLEHVAGKGFTPCVLLLISSGANIHDIDHNGNNFLMSAVKEKQHECVKMTLAHIRHYVSRAHFTTFLNHKNNSGETVVMRAAQEGDTNMIEILLSFNADLDLQNERGYTALMLALIFNQFATADFLLKAGCDVLRFNNDGDTTYMIAQTKHQTHMAEKVRSFEDMTPQARLFYAAQHGYNNVLRTLRHDIIYHHIRTSSQNPEASPYQSLAEPSQQGQQKKNTHYEKFLALLADNPNLDEYDININAYNARGLTALACAVYEGDARMVAALAKLGADLNQKTRDIFSLTPLMIAVQMKNLHTVRALIGFALATENFSLDQFFNAKDSFGKTAFHYACDTNNLAIMTLLALHEQVDLNTPDSFGNSALITAVNDKKIETVKNLLLIGADKNKTDSAGRTPLLLSLLHGQMEIANLLIDAGCDLNTRDLSGKSAINVAIDQAQLPLLLRLKQLGVQCNPAEIEEQAQMISSSNSSCFSTKEYIAHIAVHLAHLKMEHFALWKKRLSDANQVIQQLLGDCRNLNQIHAHKNFTILMDMVLFGEIEAVQALLANAHTLSEVFQSKNKYHYINAQNKQGMTALMIAVLTKNMPLIITLTKAFKLKIDPNFFLVRFNDELSGNSQRKIDLKYLKKSQESMVEESITCSSGIVLRDNKGNSALEYAVATGDIEIVRHILLATAFALPTSDSRVHQLRVSARAIKIAFDLGHIFLGTHLLLLSQNLPSAFCFGKTFHTNKSRSSSDTDKQKGLTRRRNGSQLAESSRPVILDLQQ